MHKFGSSVWFQCLVPVFGSSVWFQCLVQVFGSSVWFQCLVPVFGSSVCFCIYLVIAFDVILNAQFSNNVCYDLFLFCCFLFVK